MAFVRRLGRRRRYSVGRPRMTGSVSVLIAACVSCGIGCTSSVSTSSGSPSSQSSPEGASASVEGPKGFEHIQHVIFIVQENRSFDHYFGTLPGADGIPTEPDGSFSVCVPDPFQSGRCVPPY